MPKLREWFVPPQLIDALYTSDTSPYYKPQIDVAVNEYSIFRNQFDSKHTAIARHTGGHHWTLLDKSKTLQGLSPKDASQATFVDALRNPELLVNIAIGSAGTGKSTLSMAYAIEANIESKKGIALCKPTSTVGRSRAFGPVPGDIQEKFKPYLASFEIVLEKLVGNSQRARLALQSLRRTGKLKYVPLELMRGCTYEGYTFILDEAQNLSWHELNTLISRMGDGTKLIILGDLNQIDIKMKKEDTGLWKLVNSQPFRDSKLSSNIELINQYRSPICQLAAEVNNWLKES